MKYLMVLFLLAGSSFGVVKASEEPITEPITEPVPGTVVDEAYEIVLGFWDKAIAGASLTSVLGAILVFYMSTKRSEKLSKRSDMVITAVQALQILTSELVKEERDLKNAIISVITVANIDGMVKTQLLEQVQNNSIDMDKVQKTIDTLQAAKNALDNDEVESLLNRNV